MRLAPLLVRWERGQFDGSLVVDRKAYLDRIKRKKKTMTTEKKEVQKETPKPKVIRATLAAITQGVSFGKIFGNIERREEDGNPVDSATGPSE